MTRHRRVERVIHFDADTIANLPKASTYNDLWYDDTQQYLAIRNGGTDHISGRNIRLAYVVIAGKKEIRGALRAGVDIKRFTYLDMSGSLEDIRGRAEKIWDQYQEYRTMGKVGRGPDPTDRHNIPDGKPNVPEDILKEHPENENPNYDKLMSVLMDAYEQAANGKGSERHGNGLNFEDQDMLQVMDRVGISSALGQAIKKITEGRRLKKGKAKAEFLGAIVYLAGAIVWMDKE